jgi:hypothetical protein
MAKRRKPSKKFDAKKEVRAIARERIGTVKPTAPMESRQRRRPKHRKPIPVEEEGA